MGFVNFNRKLFLQEYRLYTVSSVALPTAVTADTPTLMGAFTRSMASPNTRCVAWKNMAAPPHGEYSSKKNICIERGTKATRHETVTTAGTKKARHCERKRASVLM